MISYVYLIGWTKLDIWYCGSQYGKSSNPANLWTTYFTSSKIVKKFREVHGEPDHIEILKEFTTREAACIFEAEKLLEYDILNKSNWLNQNIRGSLYIRGPFSAEHRRKLAESKKGKKRAPYSPEWRAKLATMKGKKHSEESKQKMSNAHKGIRRGAVASEETRQKMSAIRKGRKFTEEHRKNQSEAAKERWRLKKLKSL